MFERLLAALIILALLVLVMFIALPYPSGDRAAPTPVEQPSAVEPTVPPIDSERAKSPDAAPDRAAENKAIPTPAEKPAVTQDVPVPNPPSNKSADSENKAPLPADKIARDNPGGIETKPKQKFVKTHPERLPASAELEPIATSKVDKPAAAAAEKPKVGKPKADKLRIDKTRTETAFRSPVQPPQRYVVRQDRVRGDRVRDDGIGEYIRRSDNGPPDWHRTHYYECADGRCECACDRPYWASSGPPCSD